MRATPELKFNPVPAADLACPVCLGGFCARAARLVCTHCGRAYPIVDGIPVLIAERAETQDPQAEDPQMGDAGKIPSKGD